MRIAHSRFILMIAVALAGCSGLLPRMKTDVRSPFDDFESARLKFQQVAPYRTTVQELKAFGFDTEASGNVQQLPYPQLVSVLTPTPMLTLDHLDRGIRDCIEAQERCRAYVFRLGSEVHERRGVFVLDFLNFRRTTRTHGWRFEGLVLVRDGVVLFRNHGGEPKIDVVEERVNPLGPFQAIGEAAVRNGVMP